MKILNDFNTSVEKALSEIDPKWREYDGLIICGTHTPQNSEELIAEIEYARMNDMPFLGICFGLHLMIIEYARHVLNIQNATSEEFGKGENVVIKMPKLRVGIFPFYWRDSIPENITVNGHGELSHIEKTMESHWHNYKVNPEYITRLQGHLDLRYGDDPDIVEYASLPSHPFFTAIQFHAEYQSSKDKPHPLLVEFINKCKSPRERA